MRLAEPVHVLGAVNHDVQARGNVSLQPGDSTPGAVLDSAGGVGRNLAENLARLGLLTRLAADVGADAIGEQLLAHTAAAGVDVQACRRLVDQRTARFVALLDPDGELRMSVNDMAIQQACDPGRVRDLMPWLAGAGTVLMDANLRADALEAVAQGLPNQVPLVADAVSAAKCSRLEPVLHRLELLKLDRAEAGVLTGRTCESEAGCLAAARELAERGVARVLISRGAQGCVWHHAGHGEGSEPARSVAVVGTSGAGDALLAGVLAMLVRGADLGAAVRFGQRCAALTLQITAACHPGLADLWNQDDDQR
jgi:pseudouridine kinase